MPEFTLSERSKSKITLYPGDEAYFLQGLAAANTMIGHVERSGEGVEAADVYRALGGLVCADGVCGGWNCSLNSERFEERHNLGTGRTRLAFEEGIDASLTDYFAEQI